MCVCILRSRTSVSISTREDRVADELSEISTQFTIPCSRWAEIEESLGLAVDNSREYAVGERTLLDTIHNI